MTFILWFARKYGGQILERLRWSNTKTKGTERHSKCLVLLHVTPNISHCSWTKWQQQQPQAPLLIPYSATNRLHWEPKFICMIIKVFLGACCPQDTAPACLTSTKAPPWDAAGRAVKAESSQTRQELLLGNICGRHWHQLKGYVGLEQQTICQDLLIRMFTHKLAFPSGHQMHFLKAAPSIRKTSSESINRNRSGSSSQRNQFLAQGHFVHFAISPSCRSVNYLGL